MGGFQNQLLHHMSMPKNLNFPGGGVHIKLVSIIYGSFFKHLLETGYTSHLRLYLKHFPSLLPVLYFTGLFYLPGTLENYYRVKGIFETIIPVKGFRIPCPISTYRVDFGTPGSPSDKFRVPSEFTVRDRVLVRNYSKTRSLIKHS